MSSLLDITGNIYVRKLDLGDFAQIKGIQNIILANSDPGFIYPRSDESFKGYLSGNTGVVFGLETQRKIIAFGVLNIPKKNERSKSLRFKIIPDEDWRYHSCFIESAMVLPEHQGKGLQRILIDIRIAAAISYNIKWLCAGVKFNNYKSWRNLLTKGLTIVGYRIDSGQLIFGLAQRINGPVLQYNNEESTIIDFFDEQGHRNALDNGFVGVTIVSKGDTSSVVYKRCDM